MECLSKLLQLYMVLLAYMKIAVECLQSKSDDRYKYFNNKIQHLMKKKVVLEEMNLKASKKLDSELLLQARKNQLNNKKQEYDMQMYLSSQQVNRKRVKEIVDIAQSKLKRFQTTIQSNINSQGKELEERIKRRKMRSEAGSVQKFKVYKNKVVDVNLANQSQDFFEKALNIKVGFKEEPPGRHFRSVQQM